MQWKRLLNILLKALVLLLVAHAVVFSDLAQYQNKGMNYRLIAYPLGVFLVFIYRFITRKNKSAYPYDIDILLTTIIASDMLGNALGFYGSIEWWDDIMHLINCALFTVVFMRLIYPKINNSIMQQITVIGVVTWLQVAWELAEYVTFVTTNTCEYETAYRDTIGDLFLGQIGVLLAVQVTYMVKKKIVKKVVKK